MERRIFISASAGAVAAAAATNNKLALLGGTPVRTARFPSWPKSDASEERAILEVLRSGHWGRGSGSVVARFEKLYAELLGAKHCLATANGTSALITSLNALDVGPGDEVIVPPYTFVATVNAVLLQHALPVFIDSDRETFQMDASKLEAAITDRTVAVIPVHLGGSVADVDAVSKIASRRKIRVIEDACQSHLAEWRGRKAGTMGDTGCFSFQASKNLNSGEGGAVVTNSDELAEKCYSFHSNGRSRSVAPGALAYARNGANLRLTEFQGALLVAQMSRLEDQSRVREQNAAYLTSMLKEIPGIAPARMYPGCTRNAYHLYMFRYAKESFANAPRRAFLKALAAEGIPCSGGYTPLNKEPFLSTVLGSKAYQRIYPREVLARWSERNQCPNNDRLCEEAIWLTQTMLLGPRQDMDQIAEAIRKIQAQATDLARA